jgi:hypothetical protein
MASCSDIISKTSVIMVSVTLMTVRSQKSSLNRQRLYQNIVKRIYFLINNYEAQNFQSKMAVYKRVQR